MPEHPPSPPVGPPPPVEPPPARGLQFDYVVDAAAPATATAGDASTCDAPTGDAPAGVPTGVTCGGCRATVTTAYFQVDDAPRCADCRASAERAAAPARGWGLIGRAAAFGLAGAVVYAGVLAATDLEVGLIAILSGYLVGYTVRRGARGRGGRRVQVLAVALTYLSLGLSYLPAAVKAVAKGDGAARPTAAAPATPNAAGTPGTSPAPAAPGVPNASRAEAASVATDAADGATRAASAAPAGAAARGGDVGALPAVGVLLAFTLALPVIVVVSGLPGGLLSALIMGLGMAQAWRMTAAASPRIRGPFQVGTGPAAGAPVRTGRARTGRTPGRLLT